MNAWTTDSFQSADRVGCTVGGSSGQRGSEAGQVQHGEANHVISEAISGGRLVQLVHAALLGRNGGARRRGGGGVGGAEGWRVVEEGATYFLLPPGNGLGFGRNSRLRLVVRLLSNTQHTHAQRNAYSRRPPHPPTPPYPQSG